MIATILPRQRSHQSTAPERARCPFLIIGYGNELRGDGAVGVQVARTVAGWELPTVRAIMVHQLLPELATEMAKADYVIFVDACGEDSCARNVQLMPIAAEPDASATSAHSNSIQGLLSLTQKLYNHTPQSWLLQVPTESFDFDRQLSSTAIRGRDKAVQTIERFLINYQMPYSVAA